MSTATEVTLGTLGAIGAIATVVQTAVYLIVTYRAERRAMSELRVLGGEARPSRRMFLGMAGLTLVSWIAFGADVAARLGAFSTRAPISNNEYTIPMQPSPDPILEIERINETLEVLKDYDTWLSQVNIFQGNMKDYITDSQINEVAPMAAKLATVGGSMIDKIEAIGVLLYPIAPRLPPAELSMIASNSTLFSVTGNRSAYTITSRSYENQLAVIVREARDWEHEAVRTLEARRLHLVK